MKILISIDDTDSLGTPGTGHLCQLLADTIEERGWGRCSFISRHQLFVHPDVPYTSHNSAMCFAVLLAPDQFNAVRQLAIDLLLTHQAPGSDPGLCMLIPDLVSDPARLIAYARSAKQSVLKKENAYALAQELGIHLSEHGGTGQGIIGALAGAGLRLYGHDGRVKGKVEVAADGTVLTVADLLAQSGFAAIRAMDGQSPQPAEQILITEGRIKAILQNWQAVVPVIKAGQTEPYQWRTLRKDEYKLY